MRFKGSPPISIFWACWLAQLLLVQVSGRSNEKMQNALTDLTKKIESVEKRVNLFKRSEQSDDGEKEKGEFTTMQDDNESDSSGEGESSSGEAGYRNGYSHGRYGYRNGGKGDKDLKPQEANDTENSSGDAGYRIGYSQYGYRNGYRPYGRYGYRNGGKGEEDHKPEQANGDTKDGSGDAGYRNGYSQYGYGNGYRPYGLYGYRNGYRPYRPYGYRNKGKGEEDLKPEEAKNDPEESSEEAGYRNGYSYGRYGYRNGAKGKKGNSLDEKLKNALYRTLDAMNRKLDSVEDRVGHLKAERDIENGNVRGQDNESPSESPLMQRIEAMNEKLTLLAQRVGEVKKKVKTDDPTDNKKVRQILNKVINAMNKKLNQMEGHVARILKSRRFKEPVPEAESEDGPAWSENGLARNAGGDFIDDGSQPPSFRSGRNREEGPDVSGRSKDEGMTPQGNDESMESKVGHEMRGDGEKAEDESSMEDSALAQKLDAMNKLLSRLSNRIDKANKIMPGAPGGKD